MTIKEKAEKRIVAELEPVAHCSKEDTKIPLEYITRTWNDCDKKD